MEALRRRINLRLHWNLFPGRSKRTSLISRIIPSGWTPPNYLEETDPIWQSLTKHLPTNQGDRRPNLSREAARAWRELIHDPNHYVLDADKGGRTVIWRREDYIKEAQRQLNDQRTYKELTKTELETRLQQLRAQRARIAHTLRRNGWITASEEKRITARTGTAPPIYFKPKIHKKKRADTGTFEARPITGNTDGIMKDLDLFISKLTAPLLKLIPGSLRDTLALLNDLAKVGILPACATLFSADVEALYPSIDWDEGIEAATRFYQLHREVLVEIAKREGTLPPPDTATFKDILTVILKNHYFHFQDARFFQQIKGTAMGCSISVYLANTFMYYRMKQLIENRPPELLYLARYIDDIIGIWTGDPTKIQQTFNGVTGNGINLTFVIGGKQLEALDVTIFIRQDNTLGTKLYRKPTDGHQFVHWTSAHPTHLKRSIPYAQLLRIKRNCSETEDYEENKAALFARLRQRGYPEDALNQAETRAAAVDRNQLLQATRKSEEDKITLVTDFNRRTSKNLKETVTATYNKLLDSPLVKEHTKTWGPPLPLDPPRLAFRIGHPLGADLGKIFKHGPQSTKGIRTSTNRA